MDQGIYETAHLAVLQSLEKLIEPPPEECGLLEHGVKLDLAGGETEVNSPLQLLVQGCEDLFVRSLK